MQRQRDERGRFLPGHVISKGNRGNRNSKYGNQNARKHGLFSKQLFSQKIIGDDLILIAIHKGVAVRFFKGEWINHGDGFTILGEKAVYAQQVLGLSFKPVIVSGEFNHAELDPVEFMESSVIIKPRDMRTTLMHCIERLYQ